MKICIYYKLMQACIANSDSFLSSEIRTNTVYKLGQLDHYKLEQVLQIKVAAITM